MDSVRTVSYYLREAYDKHKYTDYVGQQLQEILAEAAQAADAVFYATTGDNERVLLTLSSASELTLYRLSSEVSLEALSFGRLAHGVLIEVRLVADQPGADGRTTKLRYLNPALAEVGGHIEIDARYFGSEELNTARASFQSLAGSEAIAER